MLRRRILMVVVICFLGVSLFGYQVTERYRLGAVVEGITFVSTGPWAGSIVFADGWGVYAHSLTTGGDNRMWSLDALPFNCTP